jgi:hypothetical protein
MAAFGTGPLIAASAGIILLGLLRTPLRWLGAAVLVLSVVWALAVPQPDILISADGRNVGVRGKDGRLHLMRTAKDAFQLKEWLAADADIRLPADPTLAEGVSCDDAGCVTEMADGGLVALALRPDALADDCERAALLVTARQAPPIPGHVAGSFAKAGRHRPAANPGRICGGRGKAKRRRSAVVAGGQLFHLEMMHVQFMHCQDASKTRTRNPGIPRCAIAHLRSGPSDDPGMTAQSEAVLRGPRIIAVAGNLGDLWGEQHRIETRTKPNHSWVNSGRLMIGGNYSRSP